MKALELTKEHKSKLLEMCKVLFPEYTTISNNKNPKFLTISWFVKQGYFIHLMDDDLKENRMIHWFEFCMTHLAEKMYNRFYSLEVCEDIRNEQLYDCFINNHPIDYLYEEFKKLKP